MWIIYLINKVRWGFFLKKWRKGLLRGDKVLVDNGQLRFEGTVVNINKSHLVVADEQLRFGAYGMNCIYPLSDDKGKV